ncbi:hypothetical protein BV898_08037 [Hypsibius exemplaris]|uniref:WAP domain-containing protein n=1 Tax=Hypsibius exemplaris TaxID=2072580 RepID=A0A1W0WRR9_HYPEX|nr:hypothetical protein BV898_08037 [Hypsibius exemplaris]
MQFLIFALAVGLAAAQTTTPMRGEMSSRKMSFAMKVLTMDPKDMHTCRTDTDCITFPTTPKCSKLFKLCQPTDVPMIQELEGDCTSDAMCTKPMRRCSNGKCAFSGPKACMTKTDCVQGVTGVKFDCMELPKTAPGMRCYLKCTQDSMCQNNMPEEFKTKIGCCGGFCQKKTAC